jgi:sugar lactone lactonase YvrE
MPVSTYMKALSLAVSVTLTPALAGAAAPTRFTHERSIYTDSADVPLRSPEGVACDDRGALVIADSGNARILTYTWKEGALDGGTQVKVPQLTNPTRVQIDSKGFVLALDRRTRRVVKLDANGGFGGYLDPQGASGGVTVTAFKLDPSDNAYLLDVVAGKVLVVAPDGKVTRELPLPSGARGITDVAAEASGKIFVVDAPTAIVYAAEPSDRTFRPISASLKEMISFPGYLMADNRGKLWVSDQNGAAIVRLGNDGSFQGRELALGWVDGSVLYPSQLCVTSGGDVIVADRSNNRVQIFAIPK